jgi:hypothetical protein
MPNNLEPAVQARDLLAAASDSDYTVLQQQAHQPDGRDPHQHLLSLWDHSTGKPEPITLAEATVDLRRILDTPSSDPEWEVRRALTIATLHEFTTRLLAAPDTGAELRDYARAVNDLATALSHQHPHHP